MNTQELLKLLQQVESPKLDFKCELHLDNKRAWGELIKDIIAIANGNVNTANQRGYLVVGADDDLNPDKTRDLYDVGALEIDSRSLLNRLSDRCHPSFEIPSCEIITVQGKNLLVITIPPSDFLYKLTKSLKAKDREFKAGDVLLRRKDGEETYVATSEEIIRIEVEKANRGKTSNNSVYKNLTTPEFIFEQICNHGLPSLIKAYSADLDNPAFLDSSDRLDILRLLQATLKCSERILNQDVEQLSSQLIGRLCYSLDPDIQKVLDNIKEWQESLETTWLEPITSSLKPPLIFLLRNLKNPRPVTALTVDTVSRKLVAGSHNGALNIWDLGEDQSSSSSTQKHKKEINTLAITPDNQKIISAAADCTIKVWDINSGNLLLDLDGHQDLINSIAITPDSRELISASDDCTLRRWSLVDGNPLEKPQEFSDPVMNSIITEDGRCVFFSIDDVIKIWDLSNDDIREFSEKHNGRINILRLFPDQKRIVSASDDSTIKIWDIEQEVCQGELSNYRASDLVVTLDGQSIIFIDDDEKVNADDKNLIIWNWHSDEIKSFEGHQDKINALALIPHRKWLITASKDQSIKIWDIANQKLLERISCNGDEPIAIAVAPSGKQFICALDNKSLQIWNLLDDQAINIDEIHDNEIDSIKFLPDEERIISVSDKQIKLWQVSDGSLLKTFTVEERIYTYAVDDKKLVLASGEDGKLTIHYLDPEFTGEKLLEGHSKRVNAIILTCDGEYAISASEDRPASASKEQRIYNLIVWNLEEGIIHKYLEGHINPISTLTANLEKKLLISISTDKTIIWNLETFELLYTVAGESTLIKQLINKNIHISPGGRYIISGTNDPDIKIWDLSNGELLFSLSRRNVSAVAVIVNSERLVSASDKSLEIWSIQDEDKPLDFLVAHSANINAVTTTSCGRYVISASDDCTVKVWDLDQSELIATFTGDSEMTSCAVANDGVTIFAGERSGRIHFLRLHGI